MSALDPGASDDLLAELDKLLASTPDLDALEDSFTPFPLDATTYVANAFEHLDGPYPCENDAVVKVEKEERPVKMHTGNRATGDGGKDARLTPYTKANPHRRKRAKDELDYLRRKVVDLEETLSSLNQVGSPKAFCASDDNKDMFSRWKQVAERQKEEANKAVVENLKLRAMLEGQLTIAKRLEAVMGEYQQQVASDAFPWHPNQTKRGIERDVAKEATRPTPSDDVIFSDLNESLEEQYRQVDSLLQTSGLAHVKTETVGKHYLKQDVQGISFLVEEVRVFPFMFQAVAGATWSCMLSPSSELYGEFQTRILEKNHLNVTILDTVQLPKSQHTRVFIA
ncbi:hypothetical protein PsorP6_001001 [Peronosclerospora sorghi]|uniref:Uncharacterized protein n=1 Tax=Peronosclerospora sorghi TaxID=230839 RepID=A0ACC0WUY1_9STRA|nr:hypothetical protein PsorP6_001001 [Peronosclerospora sorghi]